ncbi:carbon-monoxide dehydrogenase medium subunit [Tamaricihabitans halophyticus]|uniref:Carbon-monoxide dehydrogenase medium subunit n=1 Tax=Tamaricihabitans halophyticus TaxID=1262583 RepID=A0A4R2R5H0_9PSEU|nr:FAD binding domain-containing protein [Tamaricihabitans halophyticus]TCP57039.1 carbon-monoxide dehydrogenase medium subunit [Tamaricihabitans halophyticus]
MKPAAFTYHRAHDVRESIELLTELGEDAKILAGGQSLAPMMNFRLARPSALVDITRVTGLDYLRHGADGLRIGALTTHRTVETASELAGFDVLPRSAHWVGHYPIRCRGTFGGSIAHADPTSEWCLLAVLLEANIVLAGPRGQRTVPATEFFHGFFATAAEPDELIVEIHFPEPARQAALTEFAQRQGDFAIVAAAVRLSSVDGQCTGGRVVLGGVDPRPLVVDISNALDGAAVTESTWDAVGELVAGQLDPPTDAHGSGAYRKQLAATLVARAFAEAAAR